MGVAAARGGDLDQAHAYGVAAVSGGRRSLPSLVLVAAELHAESTERFPGSSLTEDFGERLRALRR